LSNNRRYHQIPADQGERGDVAGLHTFRFSKGVRKTEGPIPTSGHGLDLRDPLLQPFQVMILDGFRWESGLALH
jgi:hypothetical protein